MCEGVGDPDLLWEPVSVALGVCERVAVRLPDCDWLWLADCVVVSLGDPEEDRVLVDVGVAVVDAVELGEAVSVELAVPLVLAVPVRLSVGEIDDEGVPVAEGVAVADGVPLTEGVTIWLLDCVTDNDGVAICELVRVLLDDSLGLVD